MFKKGDKVFVTVVRMNRTDEGYREIKSVGSKYISVISGHGHIIKFYKDDCTEVDPIGHAYKLWETKQAYLDEQNRFKLNNSIRKEFTFGSQTTLRLEQLIAIQRIIDDKDVFFV